jgi:tetratricopeptide (TPR) repeat protein
MEQTQTLKKVLIGMFAVIVQTASGAGIAAIVGVADQDRSTPYDPGEIAKMPRYCKYTQNYRLEVVGGSDPAQIGKYERLMGPSLNANVAMFGHMHHYCNGIWKTNRASLISQGQGARTILLRSAIDEFDYVIMRAPDSFILLPEVLTKKGETLVQLGQGASARTTLGRAIELKRDYWPAYAALSEHYLKVGDVAKAREVLQKGLEVTPDEKALKRRLAELEKAKPKGQVDARTSH